MEGVETQGEGDVLRREGMEALQWDFRSSGGGKRREGLELWDIGKGEEGRRRVRSLSDGKGKAGETTSEGIHQVKDKAPGRQADGVALPRCNIL